MNTQRVLSVIALILAALVALSEITYYLGHRYRPGVSPHLIALSTALVLLAISALWKPPKRS